MNLTIETLACIAGGLILIGACVWLQCVHLPRRRRALALSLEAHRQLAEKLASMRSGIDRPRDRAPGGWP